MAALRIDLTEDVRSRLQTRAAEGGFATVEDYVQAMLIADAAGPGIDDAELESLLLSRAEGPFVDVNDADFQTMRQKLKDRLGAAPDANPSP